jgi:hypothetical protein
MLLVLENWTVSGSACRLNPKFPRFSRTMLESSAIHFPDFFRRRLCQTHLQSRHRHKLVVARIFSFQGCHLIQHFVAGKHGVAFSLLYNKYKPDRHAIFVEIVIVDRHRSFRVLLCTDYLNPHFQATKSRSPSLSRSAAFHGCPHSVGVFQLSIAESSKPWRLCF